MTDAFSGAIVNPDGSPNFGLWRGDIEAVNPLDYVKGFPFSLYRSFREKRWQYCGLYGQKVIVGLAVVHTGYIGNAFFYAYDRERKELCELERKSPLGLGVIIDRNVHTGRSSYIQGQDRIVIENEVSSGKRNIDIALRSGKNSFRLEGYFDDDFSVTQPLQVVTPTADKDFTFTHKSAGLPLHGSLQWNDRKFEFDPGRDCGAIDYTFGFPAYHTVWRWASMAGYCRDGRRVGLNLVEPVFHQTFTENGIWVDGKMITTAAAHFSYDHGDTLKEWRITTEDGRVDLTFSPSGKRQQNINMGVILSRFQQPFGTFQGTLKTDDGELLEIDSLPGVVEDHEAYW